MIKVGDKFPLNCGSVATVTERIKGSNLKIITDTGYETIVVSGELSRGKVHDKLFPSVYDIGFIGIGKYKSSDISYQFWKGMFYRCYDTKFHRNKPTYINCVVIEEWHNFQNFAKWFAENYVEGYHLDKDLKFYDNKEYSKDNCIFVPREINTLFVLKTNGRVLPIGVGIDSRGYYCSTNRSKRSNRLVDLVNEYWNLKYSKMISMIKKYPNFEHMLKDYFEKQFNIYYTGE